MSTGIHAVSHEDKRVRRKRGKPPSRAAASNPVPLPVPPLMTALIDALANGIFVLDADGRLVAINPAAVNMLGVAAVPQMGSRLPLAQFPAAVREFHAAGAWPRSGEVWAEFAAHSAAQQGKVVHMQISALPPDSCAAPLWLIEMVDATETQRLRRETAFSLRAEAELQQLHEELCCSFELAETAVEQLQEQNQEQATLIESLLRDGWRGHE